jgi:hypothetical protein
MSETLLLQLVFQPAGIAELEWQDAALCAQVDGDIFFPDKGDSTGPAKGVCRNCGVRPECLEYALRNTERFGVFGGLSERERRALKRQFGDDIPAAVAYATAEAPPADDLEVAS